MVGVRPESLVSTSSTAINQIKSEAADVNVTQSLHEKSHVQTEDIMYNSDYQSQQKYYCDRSLVSLLNGISTFMGYLMLKPSL